MRGRPDSSHGRPARAIAPCSLTPDMRLTLKRRSSPTAPPMRSSSNPSTGHPLLSYFDRPGTSNGPTEAINGRLEHLRGSALGLRHLAHYIARSLLETGGFRPQLHPGL
ncbi:transposase [Calidifontibacter indicus]|uniref:Transposase n=1 Tax=Calidifontibacter indicus TaxID=419650 RepID=A0A3D9UNR4_9MICO|nr:transposase [Calidifontibacter indicus]